jgi:PhzF family phenazine biosynthesis protein
MTLPITWVDAFCEGPFSGNPAAVCTHDEPLDEGLMQALAHELGIAETAYVSPKDGGDGEFALRWFSPATEIDLCGHATLATVHTLVADGLLGPDAMARFHTRSGELRARVDGERIELDFPSDQTEEIALPAPLERWRSLATHCGRASFFTLIVMPDAEAVRTIVPDREAIRAVDAKAIIVSAPGDEDGVDYVLRVFGPNVGIDEDPATGSAQCVAGPYWSSVLGRSELVAHQLSPRGAVLYVRPDGDRVHIGGNAITVFTGDLCLG